MIIAGLGSCRRSGLVVLHDDTLEFGADRTVDPTHVASILAEQDYDVDDIDAWVLDDATLADSGEGAAVAGQFDLGGEPRRCTRYPRIRALVAAAYCTSPFAARGAPTMLLVCDGTRAPVLYHVDERGRIEQGGELPLPGSGALLEDLRSTLAANGPTPAADEQVKKALREPLREIATRTRQAVRPLDILRAYATRLGLEPGGLVASAHELVADLVAEHFADRVRAWKSDGPVNLCFTGSLSLDATWNTVMRAHPMVGSLWVPPFPGGSAAMIGAAALHRSRDGAVRELDWKLRCGPGPRRHAHLPPGWIVAPCRPEELARTVHRTGRPVVVLAGREQFGAHVVGSRSILAPAVDPAIGATFDRLQHRDGHGPVVPVCLAPRAGEVFDPPTPDPYMQFQHRVRGPWVDRLPALRHLDNPVRLQTVQRSDEPILGAILAEYDAWSGIPVMCAANAFFPDALSAMRWGEIDLVWSDGILHRRATGKRQTDTDGDR
jgi:carbamoyltransferase